MRYLDIVMGISLPGATFIRTERTWRRGFGHLRTAGMPSLVGRDSGGMVVTGTA